MKRWACWFFFLLLGAGMAQAGEMSVQVRHGQVRETPSFVGRILATLDYGQEVAAGEERDNWTRVIISSRVQGWMHLSALTNKRLQLRAGQRVRAVEATTGEIALAGKGFNAEVENAYRTRNQQLNYQWIDRMGSYGLSQGELTAFLIEGQLTPQGGDQ